MVVHGGHVLAEDDPAVGVDNWRKTFTYQAKNGGFPLPLFIENTAGGGNAMARDLDAIARLWDAIGEFGAGFVLDTCHAWAAGWDLGTAVDDIRAITGRLDLVHLNNSRDPAGSSRDRHAPLADGEIPTELLLEVARAADCPIVLETPGDAARHAGGDRAPARGAAVARRRRPDTRGARAASIRSGALSRTPPAGSSTPGHVVRTTSPSGRRTSRTTRPISTRTAMSRSITPRKNHSTPMPRLSVPR